MENNEKKVSSIFEEATEEDKALAQKTAKELLEAERKMIIGETDPKPIAKEINNDPEKKNYLLLAVFLDEEEESYWWTIFTGRTAIYEYIKDNIECLDVDESMVLVDNVKLQGRVSVYKFMTHIANMKFYDDDFDVEKYHHEETSENDEVNNPSTVEVGETYMGSTYMPISDPTENVESVDL